MKIHRFNESVNEDTFVNSIFYNLSEILDNKEVLFKTPYSSYLLEDDMLGYLTVLGEIEKVTSFEFNKGEDLNAKKFLEIGNLLERLEAEDIKYKFETSHNIKRGYFLTVYTPYKLEKFKEKEFFEFFFKLKELGTKIILPQGFNDRIDTKGIELVLNTESYHYIHEKYGIVIGSSGEEILIANQKMQIFSNSEINARKRFFIYNEYCGSKFQEIFDNAQIFDH